MKRSTKMGKRSGALALLPSQSKKSSRRTTVGAIVDPSEYLPEGESAAVKEGLTLLPYLARRLFALACAKKVLPFYEAATNNPNLRTLWKSADDKAMGRIGPRAPSDIVLETEVYALAMVERDGMNQRGFTVATEMAFQAAMSTWYAVHGASDTPQPWNAERAAFHANVVTRLDHERKFPQMPRRPAEPWQLPILFSYLKQALDEAMLNTDLPELDGDPAVVTKATIIRAQAAEKLKEINRLPLKPDLRKKAQWVETQFQENLDAASWIKAAAMLSEIPSSREHTPLARLCSVRFEPAKTIIDGWKSDVIPEPVGEVQLWEGGGRWQLPYIGAAAKRSKDKVGVYFTSIPAQHRTDPPFDVYKNPSFLELRDKLGLGTGSEVRAFIDGDDLYAWKAYSGAHHWVAETLGWVQKDLFRVEFFRGPMAGPPSLVIELKALGERAPTRWETHPFFATRPKIFSTWEVRFVEDYRKLKMPQQDWESAKRLQAEANAKWQKENVGAVAKKSYRYVGACLDAACGMDIQELVEHSTRVSRDTFVANTDDQDRKEVEAALGYDRHLPISKAPNVFYRKGVYRGVPCYYLTHSAIEYIFTLEGELGPSLAKKSKVGARPIPQLNRQSAENALLRAQGNQSEAANELGIHRKTLRLFIQKEGIDVSQYGLTREKVEAALAKTKGSQRQAAIELGVSSSSLNDFVKEEGIDPSQYGHVYKKRELSRKVVEKALDETQGNQRQAARDLGMSPTPLRRFIQKEGIDLSKYKLTRERVDEAFEEARGSQRQAAKHLGIHVETLSEFMRREGIDLEQYKQKVIATPEEMERQLQEAWQKASPEVQASIHPTLRGAKFEYLEPEDRRHFFQLLVDRGLWNPSGKVGPSSEKSRVGGTKYSRERVEKALQDAGGSQIKAAQQLGIFPSGLSKILKRLGIKPVKTEAQASLELEELKQRARTRAPAARWADPVLREENRAKTSEEVRRYHAGLTPEERAQRNRKVSEATRLFWENMTPEARAQRVKKIAESIRLYHEMMTPEERAQQAQRVKEWYEQLSPEEKAQHAQKAKERWALLPLEEKAAHRDKVSVALVEWWASRPPAELEAAQAKAKARFAALSPEQKRRAISAINYKLQSTPPTAEASMVSKKATENEEDPNKVGVGVLAHQKRTKKRGKDKIGASDLWSMVQAVQAHPRHGNKLNEKDCEVAHALYAKAVNFAMERGLPFSSVRVVVAARRQATNIAFPLTVTFLGFNGLEWSAWRGRAPTWTKTFPSSGKWGQAYLEFEEADLDKQQQRALKAVKVPNKPLYRVTVERLTNGLVAGTVGYSQERNFFASHLPGAR